MPYKNKEEQRKANRLRMQKVRQKVTQEEGNTSMGNTYPAIIYALADKEKRAKLERLCAVLRARNLLREVRYGVRGPTFDVVSDFLDALRA